MTSSVKAEGQRLFGASVSRVEDLRLITGQGTFVADITLPGMLEVAFVRSPHAHAEIVGTDLSNAREVPGTVAVLAAGDLTGKVQPLRAESSLEGYFVSDQPLLADRVVRFVGEAVAAVIGSDRYAAEDAADAVRVTYRPLAAVVDPHLAMMPESALVHDDCPRNLVLSRVFHAGEPDGALTGAHGVIRTEFRTGRQLAVPMETRGCVARYEAATGILTLWYSTQIGHIARTGLAKVLNIPENRIRIITPDVGGGFGNKTSLQPEEVVVAHLAIRTGRPVRWIEDRRENFVASSHARDHRYSVEAAYTAEGVITAVKAKVIVDVGAYSLWPWTSSLEPGMAGGLLTGPYRIQNYHCDVFAITTNKCPVGAYRGVSRPNTVFVMDGIIDRVARATDLDPATVRMRNLIRAEDYPYRMATRVVQDKASHMEAFMAALSEIGYTEWRVEQAKARTEGRYIGIGMGCYAELTGLGSKAPVAPGAMVRSGYEYARVRIDPSGHATVYTGISAMGQGLETTMGQIAADTLGLPLSNVRVVLGDTDAIPYGMGSYASRGAVMGGGAVMKAAEAVREKLVAIAAHLFSANPNDMVVVDGEVRVSGSAGQSLKVKEIASLAYWEPHRLPPGLSPGLEGTEFFDPLYGTVANGTHIAVVEVQAATGEYRILKYLAVDDCGRMINPAIVKGQIIGGIAQGIGGASYERIVYDDEGQLLTGSLMDYLIPTAMEIPHIDLRHLETPATSPTGVKGVGEAGTVPVNAVIAGAIADAIPGAEFTETPITPEAVFWALNRISTER